MKRTSVDGVLALSLLLLLLLLLVWVNDPSDEFRASSSPGGDAEVADDCADQHAEAAKRRGQ